MSAQVILKNVTILYPHLWVPHAAVPGADAKYAAEFMFSQNSPAHQAMYAAMQQVLTEENKMAMAGQIKPPWQTGEEINARRASKGKPPRPEIAGQLLVTAKDPTIPPVVVTQDGRTRITEDMSANIFGGCIVNADLDVYWSKNPSNPGLFCGLRGVQLVDNVNVQRLGDTGREVNFEPVEGAPAMLTPPEINPGPMPTDFSWL